MPIMVYWKNSLRCFRGQINSFVAYASWPKLIRLRESFISKIVTSFSISTFIIANFIDIIKLFELSPWRLWSLFIGSALFISGYIAVGFLRPSEFQEVRMNEDIVRDMLTISDVNYVNGRVIMTRNLVKRMSSRWPCILSRSHIDYVIKSAVNASKMTEWDEKLAAVLYHADLSVRQFDHPEHRVVCLILLGAGLIAIAAPTGFSVFEILF